MRSSCGRSSMQAEPRTPPSPRQPSPPGPEPGLNAFRRAGRHANRARGPVAQWLEPTAHNGLVAGSSPAGPTSLRSLRELWLGKPAQGDWGRCEGRLPPAHCLPDKNSPTTLGLRVGMTLTLGGCKEVR